MSLTNCRFYEEKYPEVESFVMVNVKQIAEMGAYVKLLEYGMFGLYAATHDDLIRAAFFLCLKCWALTS